MTGDEIATVTGPGAGGTKVAVGKKPYWGSVGVLVGERHDT